MDAIEAIRNLGTMSKEIGYSYDKRGTRWDMERVIKKQTGLRKYLIVEVGTSVVVVLHFKWWWLLFDRNLKQNAVKELEKYFDYTMPINVKCKVVCF